MPAMPRIDPPRLVQFAAVLAILAGLLFWGYPCCWRRFPAWSRPMSPTFRRPAARTPLNAGSRRLPVRSRCNWRD